MRFFEHKVSQRTSEWRALRLGRLTGSRAYAMTAKIKTGEAAARRNLRLALVLEQLTGRSQESDYVSAAMQAGIDRESDAIGMYEALTGNVVFTSGFLQLPDLMAGCSLDGHLGDFTRLLSIKCRQPAAHLDFLQHDRIPSESLMQMVHELWITDAIEHTYFSYNPDFPEPLQAKWRTVKRDDCGLGAYDGVARAFLAEVEAEVIAVRALAARVEAVA